MINVAITWAGNSLALNGAALYVNRFLQHKNDYLKKGIEIKICDGIHSFTDAKAYEKTEKFTRRKNIKKILLKSYIGNLITLYFSQIKHAKEALNNNYEYIKNCNLVIANDFFTAYYIQKKFKTKKIIYVMHNNGDILHMHFITYPKLRFFLTANYLKKISQTVLKNSEKIVFVSDTARLYFNRQNPALSEKTIYIPQCIEDANFNQNPDFTKLNLICVGTVSKRKNQFSVIEAIENFDKTKVSLTIIGGGDELEKCTEYVENKHLNNIYLLGPQNNVIEYFNKANCFILASLDEGLPTVAIEAIRAGLPLILTDVGGCKELIDNNGILLKNGNVEEIKKGIEYMLNNLTKLSEMSKSSREQFINKFKIEKLIDQYISLIKITL